MDRSKMNTVQLKEADAIIKAAGLLKEKEVLFKTVVVAHKIPKEGRELDNFCLRWNLMPIHYTDPHRSVQEGERNVMLYCLHTQQYINHATRLIELMGRPIMYLNEYDLAIIKQQGLVIEDNE